MARALEMGKDDQEQLVHSQGEEELGSILLPAPESRLPRRRVMRNVGIAALIAGALLAVSLSRHWTAAGSQSVATRSGATSETVAFSEKEDEDDAEAADTEDEEEPAEPVPCSKEGKDCSKSKCCTSPGFTCYKKNKGWAACRRSCTAGRDPTDPDPKPWECEALGNATAGLPLPPDYTVTKAPWVIDECSAAGEDCSDTKCCKEAGAQCYEKSKGWSACKAYCTPGPDPTDLDDTPWTCKPLGMRTPGPPSKSLGKAQAWVQDKCSVEGENCLHTKCCKEPGYQCFQKKDSWAMCRPFCIPGPLLVDRDPEPWNCTALGGRTPGIPKQKKVQKVAPWVAKKCAKTGENCEDKMCCAEATHQCYRKAPGWAACMPSCQVGVHKGDKGGGAWSCEPIGARTPRPWQTPSLYCVSVIMLSTYEADIMRQALWKGGLGIFACDLYDVFSQEGETVLGTGPNGEVRTHHFVPAPVTRSVDGTAGNTALFINVWEAVKACGKYDLTDWTIKADPDAVIFPDRLRGHLKYHPAGSPAYIVNCNKPMATGPMMFGSLEAINHAAWLRYFGSGGRCHKNYQWGEDRWLGECLKELGVMPVNDFSLVGDGVCTGNNACHSGQAAFHPFKSAAAWLGCYYAAGGR